MDLDELIHKCQKGNRQAQAELYRRYSGVLFGMCLKYSRNKTEAEDNLHNRFMTIFDKINQFGFKGSFEGWIKRITVNTVLQKYRKDQHLNLISENTEDEVEVDTEDTDISLATLLGYIQELPHKYRLRCNLYMLNGYSHKEISAMLRTSAGTSKSNVARGKAILRDRIEKAKTSIA